MGADFVFNQVTIPTGKEKIVKRRLLKAIKNYKIPELSDKVKVKMLHKITGGSSEEFKQFCDFWDNSIREFENNLPKKEGGEILTEKEAKEFMINTVNEFFESLSHRDVSCMFHKGDTIYLTGGMSWGDEPTESCNIFNTFNYLPPIILGEAGIII